MCGKLRGNYEQSFRENSFKSYEFIRQAMRQAPSIGGQNSSPRNQESHKPSPVRSNGTIANIKFLKRTGALNRDSPSPRKSTPATKKPGGNVGAVSKRNVKSKIKDQSQNFDIENIGAGMDEIGTPSKVRYPTLETRLRGHTGPVSSVSIYSDSQLIVSSSLCDTSILLWDITDEEHVHQFQGHTAGVYSVRFMPGTNNVRMFASGSADTSVRLWKVSFTKVQNTDNFIELGNHLAPVRQVTFSHDDTSSPLLYSCSDDCTIKIWNVEERRRIRTIHEHEAPVRTCDSSPFNSQHVLSGSSDHSMNLYDCRATRPLVHSFTESGSAIETVLFHPTIGHYCLNASAEGMIRVYDTRTLQEVKHWRHDGVSSMSIHPGGKYLLSSSVHRTVNLWDFPESLLMLTLEDQSENTTCVSFSPDGNYFVTGGTNDTLMYWKSHLGREVAESPYPVRSAHSLSKPEHNNRAGHRSFSDQLSDVSSLDKQDYGGIPSRLLNNGQTPRPLQSLSPYIGPRKTLNDSTATVFSSIGASTHDDTHFLDSEYHRLSHRSDQQSSSSVHSNEAGQDVIQNTLGIILNRVVALSDRISSIEQTLQTSTVVDDLESSRSHSQFTHPSPGASSPSLNSPRLPHTPNGPSLHLSKRYQPSSLHVTHPHGIVMHGQNSTPVKDDFRLGKETVQLPTPDNPTQQP